MHSMMLGLTTRCNMSCPYCFNEQNNQDMPREIARRAIEWFIETCDEENPTVNFFGGEPLLMYDEIIVPILEEYGDRINFGITTNAFLLDEDKVDFLRRWGIQPLVSFDGVVQVQNSQRPAKSGDSFEVVCRNLPYLLLRFPNTTMRATVTKESIPYLYESYKLGEELGFRQITFCPNAFESWDTNDGGMLHEEFDKICHYIYTSLSKGINVPKMNPIIKRFNDVELMINGRLKFNDSLKRCGLGTNTCAVTPDGNIIPCQEKISHPTFIIGDVWNGIDKTKHEEFLSWYQEELGKFSCPSHCHQRERLVCFANFCPSRMEDLNFHVSSSECVFIHVSTEFGSKMHCLCADSSNKLIRAYFK